MTNSDRDGYKVKIMSILTAVLLPGTFMAVGIPINTFRKHLTDN
jgi:hypothetical protein